MYIIVIIMIIIIIIIIINSFYGGSFRHIAWFSGRSSVTKVK